MKFENSKYFNPKKSKNLILPFGNFYLFDFFCISEINEGVHIGLEISQEIIVDLVEHYGENLKIGFISNRNNSYSIDTRLWSDLNNELNFITATAIVTYNKLNFNNATIEKKFSNNSIKRCSSIDQAIEWMLSLKEFKPDVFNSI